MTLDLGKGSYEAIRQRLTESIEKQIHDAIMEQIFRNIPPALFISFSDVKWVLKFFKKRGYVLKRQPKTRWYVAQLNLKVIDIFVDVNGHIAPGTVLTYDQGVKHRGV